MQKQVGDTLSARLANPGDVFQPARTRAIGSVNSGYQSIGDRLKANYAGRGFGRSGKVLTNARQLESSRLGDIGSLDAKFAGMQTDYESQLLDQATRFGFTTPGNSSTQPGGPAGGAVSGGLSTLTTLLSLNKLLSGNAYKPGPMGSGETGYEYSGLPGIGSEVEAE